MYGLILLVHEDELLLTAEGQLIVGAIWSTSVTVKLQEAVFPEASLTVYVTVVTPPLNDLVPKKLIPLEGEFATVAPVNAQVTVVTEQLSP